MRRFTPSLALLLVVLPLVAAIPANRVKEPNAVFAYDVDPSRGRVTAVLFDRLRGKAIDHLDARTDLPLVAGNGGGNDSMQFSPATGKIYAAVSNVNMEAGTRADESLPYDAAIVETDFEFREPKIIFSCNDCTTDYWIVHPTEPKLYVSIADPYKDGADEFRDAKLVEIVLGAKRRTRVMTRIPAVTALRVTPDGKKLFTFGLARNSNKPYGEVVTVNVRDRKRTKTVVNFPSHNDFGLSLSPQSTDLSPDALEIAYHMNVIDVRTKDTEELIEDSPYALDSYTIGWSRDANQLLFQLRKAGESDERTEVPLVYNRATDREWILPLQDANLLDWSPSQTAILFLKRRDIGFYDLRKRAWTHVFEGTVNGGGDASWITMPTKKVPKR